MPTLGNVHSTVSRWLRRGNVFDVDVPDMVRLAARSVERNYTLKYMERYVTLTLSATSTEPRAISMPLRVKKIHFIKILGEEGKFHDLFQIDPREFGAVGIGQPKRYWLDGVDYIWFDKTPDKDYPAEMMYSRYTDWPTSALDTDTFSYLDSTNWLTENADDILVGHALTHAKILARLPADIRQEIDALVVRAANELVRADEELRNANSSLVMNYGVVE